MKNDRIRPTRAQKVNTGYGKQIFFVYGETLYCNEQREVFLGVVVFDLQSYDLDRKDERWKLTHYQSGHLCPSFVNPLVKPSAETAVEFWEIQIYFEDCYETFLYHRDADEGK